MKLAITQYNHVHNLSQLLIMLLSVMSVINNVTAWVIIVNTAANTSPLILSEQASAMYNTMYITYDHANGCLLN